MKKMFLTAACLLAAGMLRGQSAELATVPYDGPWSLSRCIDHALDHNLTVQRSELTVTQREIDLSTAEARRLPSLSGNASQNFSFGRGLTADNTYANTNTSK